MGARYLKLSEAEWTERLESLSEIESECRICPRECRVNRQERRGLCRAPAQLRVSSTNLHFGEEPPITGRNGSGTVFLTHCNLYCLFCQNYPISQLGNGQDISEEDLAQRMIDLQKRGAHNINFVSPTHYTARIAHTIHCAMQQGLEVPIVWNSNGYESVDVLKCMDGIVDIYLPDLKYSKNENAEKLSHAPSYWEIATQAIKEMHRQVGLLQVEDDIATSGLLVRHLVLPHDLSGTREVLRFIAEELSRETTISLMAQYFPAHRAPQSEEMSRQITSEEYGRAMEWLEEFGIENGYTQEDLLRFC